MVAIALVVVIAGLLIFLIYSIINVAFNANGGNKNAPAEQNMKPKPIPYKASFDEVNMEDNQSRMVYNQALQRANEVAPKNNHHEEPAANVEEPRQIGSTKLETPDVVGQPPEELNAPEPLQERISNKVESHEPLDPYEKNENVALFGSNLRHPEASMERSSANNGAMENEIVAGLASQVSKPTDLDKVQFAAEMAQNGGEFMNGIFAYDSSEGGSYFSSL
jgi:hypothetical protein